jgi:hypothetical protein
MQPDKAIGCVLYYLDSPQPACPLRSLFANLIVNLTNEALRFGLQEQKIW